MPEISIKLVHLQLTKRCNLRCSFCGQWGESGFMRGGKEIRELDFSEWETVISSIAANAEKAKNKPQFVIWGGEPLLSPSFANVAILLKSHGFETGLVTNGTLIEKFASVINENIDVLYVSLDGPEEIHNRIRGCEGAFRKIARGMAKIESSKVGVVLLTTICRANYNHLIGFPEYVAGKLPVVGKIIMQNMIHVNADEARSYALWLEKCCGQAPEHIDAWSNGDFEGYVRELPAVINEIQRRIDEKSYTVEVIVSPEKMKDSEIIDWYLGDRVPKEDVDCMLPFSHLHIRPDGNVDTCVDFDDFTAGNVRSHDIMEIFNGSEMEKFRQSFLKCRPAICKRCPWRLNQNPGLDVTRKTL